jgi:hypothetical protein
MNSITQKDIDRFWQRVDKEKSTTFYKNERCWEWAAGHIPDGYGTIKISGKLELAHRVSWVIANGGIPDGLHVLHHCDNPGCVRQSHIWLGTHQDNMDDKATKGRGNQPRGDNHYSHTHPEKLARGESHANSKLTWEQVREIRKRYAWFGIGGDSSLTLAKEFGVDNVAILKIVRNETWKE